MNQRKRRRGTQNENIRMGEGRASQKMKGQITPGRKWMNMSKGELGEVVGGCRSHQESAEPTVGKVTGGEAEAGPGAGRERLLEIQSNFSRMEGNMSRGKDKQTN